MRMTIGKKLGFGFGIVLLLMLGLGAVSYWTMAQMGDDSTIAVEELHMASTLMERVQDHLKWSIALSDQFLLNKSFEGELDPHKCTFGQWYDSFKADDPKIKEVYATIDEPHRALHNSGAKIKDLYAKGDREGAQQVYANETQPASEELQSKIGKMVNILTAEADQEEDKLKATLHNGDIIILIALILSFIVGAIIAFLIGRAIVGPIRKLAGVAEKVSKGDLTENVVVTGDDEVAQLATAFFNMVVGLRELVQEIQKASFSITSASNQILTASQEQATGIEEEATQISEVATSSKQLSATARQVTDHSNEIAKAAATTMQIANSGSEAVNNVVVGIENVKQSVLETAKKIESLGERSQMITEIVSLIEDVADQTNLLSLNAAIEAARAGESGKGFAVVADAIGKLADKTTKSTSEISDLIKGIQQDTSSSVMGMERSTKETMQGVVLAQEADKRLKEIVESFKQVASSAKEIALSSQQQASGSEQISKAMIGVDQIMKQSAVGAKQSIESVRELSHLTENLKKMVSKFKLSEKQV